MCLSPKLLERESPSVRNGRKVTPAGLPRIIHFTRYPEYVSPLINVNNTSGVNPRFGFYPSFLNLLKLRILSTVAFFVFGGLSSCIYPIVSERIKIQPKTTNRIRKIRLTMFSSLFIIECISIVVICASCTIYNRQISLNALHAFSLYFNRSADSFDCRCVPR